MTSFAPRSLAHRMAYATAGSATIAGILAALVSFLVANRMMQGAEDGRLQGAAIALLHELPKGNRSDEALRSAGEDEQKELEPSRIRIAIHRAGTFVAGDPSIAPLRAGECTSSARAGITLRACAAEQDGLMVIASGVHLSYGLGTTVFACLASALVAALCAIVASRKGARWALEPLTRLRQSLETVAIGDPAHSKIASDDACAEVAEVRAALSALIVRLGDALEAARNYSAEAAHELKTPLTAIRAELDLLAEEPLGEKEQQAVERLRARVISVSNLVERLLLLATVANAPTPPRDAVALEDLVRDRMANLDPDYRDRIVFHAEGAGMVRGDEVLLAALVENVLDNALKFSSNVVTVRLCEGADVVLEVRDRGPGIPKETRKRAFEAFFRTPEARGRNTRGHGVGLALVARIATAHQGTAGFVDPPVGEEGACFQLMLPPWKEEG